LSGLFQ